MALSTGSSDGKVTSHVNWLSGRRVFRGTLAKGGASVTVESTVLRGGSYYLTFVHEGAIERGSYEQAQVCLTPDGMALLADVLNAVVTDEERSNPVV